MGELVLLENEIINVYEGSEKEQIVSGRELYDFLEVKTPYKKWFDRMTEYGFDENVDFIVMDKNVQDISAFGGVRKVTEHYLKLDMAKELSMIQRTDKGKMARQYFISVEKKYRELTNQAPMTMEDLIIHNAQLLKETRLKQEEQDRKLKLLETQQTEQTNKVVEMVDYITTVPDFKAVEIAINKYARRANLNQGEVWGMVYRKVEDVHGIDIKTRVNNAKKKLQKERVESGKAPYKESTLKQKVKGTDIIKELKLEKNIVEILMAMGSELK